MRYVMIFVRHVYDRLLLEFHGFGERTFLVQLDVDDYLVFCFDF